MSSKIRMNWAWPGEANFKGGSPRKAWVWNLKIALRSGCNHDELDVTTDGPIKLSELYAAVQEHVDNFRETVGPLTNATITGTGTKPSKNYK